eukprot:UN01819
MGSRLSFAVLNIFIRYVTSLCPQNNVLYSSNLLFHYFYNGE